MRAESIRKQLNEELSTNSENQNIEERVDASEINITAMGTQNQENQIKKN